MFFKPGQLVKLSPKFIRSYKSYLLISDNDGKKIEIYPEDIIIFLKKEMVDNKEIYGYHLLIRGQRYYFKNRDINLNFFEEIEYKDSDHV
jgi:hypothetical protein